MSRTVTIDIETLPAPALEEFCLTPKSTGRSVDEYAKTALNGDFGRLLCIGYIDEDKNGVISKGVIGWDEKTAKFSSDERIILSKFWKMMNGFRPTTDRVIGHNIFDFDLKFIYKRSVVHEVKPSVELSFARYRSTPIFDTMCEWERWSYGSRISLDRLSSVLGLKSSKTEDVNGSRINELFVSGQHQAIRNYCMRDVELTRHIYRRMTFAKDFTCGIDSTDADVQFTTSELKSRESVVTVF